MAHHQTPNQIIQNNAGARISRVCRITGTTVTLYDGEPAEMDTSDGRWQTVCEDHSFIVCHKTFALAKAWLPRPDEWCEGCQEIVRKRLEGAKP